MNNFDNSRKTKPSQTSVKTNLDDWETDPDFVSDLDEIDQRWGSKHRTVGSINMNELLEEVRKDHKLLREKLNHPSQRDYSGGFGGKFGIQSDRKDKSALDYDYLEELSKHSSQEIKREIIKTTSSSSSSSNTLNQGLPNKIVSDAKKSFLERTSEEKIYRQGEPKLSTKTTTTTTNVSTSDSNDVKPKVSAKTFLNKNQFDNNDDFYKKTNYYQQQESYKPTTTTTSTSSPQPKPPTPSKESLFKNKDNLMPKYEESSMTKRYLKEEKSTSSSSLTSSTTTKPIDVSPAFKSIQEKIDAFKKEFQDIENKVGKKTDLSKLIEKTTKFEKSHSDVEYVSRNPISSNIDSTSTSNYIKSTKSQEKQQDFPIKTSIKSLSEKFETLGQNDSEDFKRKTEAKRKEFFDQIKNQVRETRKELDGFDPIDEDVNDNYDSYKSIPTVKKTTNIGSSERLANLINSSFSKQQQQQQQPQQQRLINSSPQSTSRPSSRLSGNSDIGSQASSMKPKVYTKRETTEERIVSKIVKENDKIIEDETKREVKRSSSCHGSSSSDDDDDFNVDGPRSIRVIEKELRNSSKSPNDNRTESPIDRLKREIPIVEPEIKGAGLMARTLYDYEAVENDELSFDVDDLITNIEKVDKGWYKGTISYKNGRKQTGLFPANYVKLLNDNDGEY